MMNVVENNGWIPISKLKPLTDGSYLTFCQYSPTPKQVHRWVKAQQGWEHELMRNDKQKAKKPTWITHWQPLPMDPLV